MCFLVASLFAMQRNNQFPSMILWKNMGNYKGILIVHLYKIPVYIVFARIRQTVRYSRVENSYLRKQSPWLSIFQ